MMPRHVLLLLILLPLSACTVEEVPGNPGHAEEGDPCVEHGSYACAPDQVTELICEEGWFVFNQECGGGCSVEESPEGAPELVCAGS